MKTDERIRELENKVQELQKLCDLFMFNPGDWVVCEYHKLIFKVDSVRVNRSFSPVVYSVNSKNVGFPPRLLRFATPKEIKKKKCIPEKYPKNSYDPLWGEPVS